DSIPVPVQIVYGERDDTATWHPIVERARELGYEVESLPADHFFVSQRERVAETVVSFLRTQIR
ncbi:MAG: alpha/beta hydrolase, partial [Halovenus sp.]